MDNIIFIRKLEVLNMNEDAITWFTLQPDPQSAWNNCPRPDWMIMMIDKGSQKSKNRKLLTLALCEIERIFINHGGFGISTDNASKAIEIAESWAKNKGTDFNDVIEAASKIMYFSDLYNFIQNAGETDFSNIVKNTIDSKTYFIIGKEDQLRTEIYQHYFAIIFFLMVAIFGVFEIEKVVLILLILFIFIFLFAALKRIKKLKKIRDNRKAYAENIKNSILAVGAGILRKYFPKVPV